MLGFLGRFAPAQDCRVCGCASTAALCPGCDADLSRLPAARCPVCALPTPGAGVCGRCLAYPPAFDATCAALCYEFPATRLIQTYKYGRAVGLAPMLASLLEAQLRDAGESPPDLVIAMPSSPERLRERGFNQALEVARVLARHMNLRVDARAVARIRHGPAQADLPLADRARNVRGAFTARRRLDGLDIAVVDDVMTSGATLDALAGALKKAGAARVRNWVVARTLK